METFTINANPRAGVGTKNAKLDRTAGNIPCVIYGGGKNISCTVDPLSVRGLIYSADFKVVELNIEGEAHRCILKDIQFHPVTDQVQHMDFLSLTDGHPVKIDVPVRCVGASEGVKVGGKLQQKMRRVKIKTLPEKMVDHLTVDITALELGDSVRVRDIELPEGVEIMNPLANPVASVEIPRALRSATAGEEGEEGEEEEETTEE